MLNEVVNGISQPMSPQDEAALEAFQNSYVYVAPVLVVRPDTIDPLPQAPVTPATGNIISVNVTTKTTNTISGT